MTDEPQGPPRQRIVACAVGQKGRVFLADLGRRGVDVDHVCSYEQPDDLSGSFAQIRSVAAARGASFEASRRPAFAKGDLVFLVGWQYLVPPAPEVTLIVFHDSLLPRYRGFAPTVTALIKGDPQIGVTALRPTPGVDEGPIVAQASIAVTYPIKIAAALEQQALLMGRLAAQIIASWKEGSLATVDQDAAQATYSLWRDEQDFIIDWSHDAAEIRRMIDATGYPYAGAQTTLGDETILVDEATVLPDFKFEIRMPGKVWSLESNAPVVVCGSGLLRLDRCRTLGGAAANFKRLRVRLGASKFRGS